MDGMLLGTRVLDKPRDIVGVILHFRILVVSILPTSHPHPLLRSRKEFSLFGFFSFVICGFIFVSFVGNLTSV